jgi:hypothetical protein
MKKYASKEDTQMVAAAEDRQKIDAEVKKMLDICICRKETKE